MTAIQITSLAVLEAVGLFMIGRLWFGKQKSSLVRRIIWSVLLLIPLFGPLMYGFISIDPSEHGEDVGDHSSGGGVGDTGHHL
jgi:hypothetical protein